MIRYLCLLLLLGCAAPAAPRPAPPPELEVHRTPTRADVTATEAPVHVSKHPYTCEERRSKLEETDLLLVQEEYQVGELTKGCTPLGDEHRWRCGSKVIGIEEKPMPIHTLKLMSNSIHAWIEEHCP